jgi:hypothetical protein
MSIFQVVWQKEEDEVQQTKDECRNDESEQQPHPK